ncbi:MAG TPA: phosphatase PAP2 family protein [Sphingobacteriaceae bacterium]
MTTKQINIRTILLTGLLFGSVMLTAFYLPANDLHPLEAVRGHYRAIKTLNEKPNPARAALDTITYPWTEYSNGALAKALMRTYYLSREQENHLPALIKSPANSSDQTNADLAYLLDLQKRRTPEEVRHATAIGEVGSWPEIINPTDPAYKENLSQLFYIATPVGEWFNPESFPATTQLLKNTLQDIRVTEFRLKQYFKRPRPYHLSAEIEPVMKIKSPSFASGHTLWAFTQAFLFAEIIPAKRNEFLKRAEEVRWSRELLGIHFPTDNEASRIVSWHLLNKWMENPQFITDLERAKAEWRSKSKSFQ